MYRNEVKIFHVRFREQKIKQNLLDYWKYEKRCEKIVVSCEFFWHRRLLFV